MPTATRGAAGLILLGALLAQAPLAAAYEPRDRSTSSITSSEPSASSPSASSEPSALPSAAPSSSTGTAGSEPTIAPEPDPTAPGSTGADPANDRWPVAEPPAARSWRDVVQQVTQTSPDKSMLRATTLAHQSQQVMRCFRLETENYCLGFGFVDKVPTGAQISATSSAPAFTAEGDTGNGTETGAGSDAGTEQDIATGALSPADFVAERSAVADGVRLTAELNEMETAWAGREKARALRDLDDKPRTTPPPPVPPTPVTSRPAVVQPALPASSYIMKGFQTSQEKGYWCGPATFQSIDWADDKQKDTQASWAKDLGATTSGTAISAMVKQTNLKTNWDVAAGTYIVQNVGHWNTQKFFTVHQNHLGDSKPAPVIEHTQLLKRYFPYLAFNHSGHYQVGRGYDKKNGTIAIFEVFNERRFNSRGNVTDGPKNIPASALFNATLANAFKNIGL